MGKMGLSIKNEKKASSKILQVRVIDPIEQAQAHVDKLEQFAERNPSIQAWESVAKAQRVLDTLLFGI